jgi:hypothetical protein
VFIKELQPHFEKFVGYFDELVSNIDLSLSALMHTVSLNFSNIELASKDNILLSNNTYVNFFKTHKKYVAFVGDICKLIGTNHKLYELTVETLVQQYLKTRDLFYATLRIHLVVKLAELHHHDVVQTIVVANVGTHSDSPSEMIFKFCNIIASCLKDRTLGTKRAKELEHIMESKKFEKIIP